MGRAKQNIDVAFQHLFDVVEEVQDDDKPETVESILSELPDTRQEPETVESILSELTVPAEPEPSPFDRERPTGLPEVRLSERPQVLEQQERAGTLVTQAFGGAIEPIEELGRRFVRGTQIQAEVNKQVIEGLGAVARKTSEDPKAVAEATKIFGQGLIKVPRQVAAQAVTAAQGFRGASVVDRGFGDRFVAKAHEDNERFVRAVAKKHGDDTFMPGIPFTALAELPQNLGFSGVSLLGGAAVGTPVAFLPIPGARPAAVAAGTVASGALAFNMASYQIMQEYLEVKNQESIQKRGRGITQEEEDKLKKQFNSAAIKHGLWEAIPEMIGTGITASNILRPLTKVVGKSMAAQIAGRVASTYAGELVTETVTEMGQQRIRAAAELPGAREVDFTNPSDWLSALQDIAPQTFLLTTVTSGAGVGAVATVRKISSLKQEIGETHPQFEQFSDAIKNIEDKSIPQEAIEKGKVTFPAEQPEIGVVPEAVEQELVEESRRQLPPDVKRLLVHPVRVKGFDLASDKQIGNFFDRLLNIAEKYAPNKTQQVQEGIDEYLRTGGFGNLSSSAEETIGEIHQDVLNELRASRQIGKQLRQLPEEIAGEISTGKNAKALTELGYDAKQIDRMLPEEAERVLSTAIPAERASVLQSGEVAEVVPPPGDIQAEIIKDEPQFIDESPPVGLGIKQVIPPEIEVIRPEKDLSGFTGLFMRWMSPVRTIMMSNPTVNQIARDGRDTMSGMANEINHFGRRVDTVKRGLSAEEQAQVVEFLESDREVDVTTVPEKLQPAYIEMDNIRSEMLEIIREDMGIDTSEWGMTPEQFWPHVFVGEYQVQVEEDGNWHTVDGGFSRNLREAVDKASAVLADEPGVNIRIKPRGFNQDYSATLLTRRGFGRFIGEVEKATQLDKDEIVSMLRGVAAIKPRGKFVGNFKQRSANLGGYMTEFDAMKIYTSRVLRKKWLDPFRKRATNQAQMLPPSLKKYFEQYIDDVSGKYDPDDNGFIIRTVTSRITRAQSALKLGFRVPTALVNRLQPTQLAFAEIGFYLQKGYIFKKTAKGQEIIERSGIAGELPIFAEGATGARRDFAQNLADIFAIRRKVPATARLRASQNVSLALFSIAEQANRADTVAGGYLFAKKVFTMPRDKAERRGLDYVYDYLDQFEDPETAAIEFGRDLNTDVNFIVSNADLPQILRGPVRKTALQFKSFPINFLATTLKWIGGPRNNAHYRARAARFIVANTLVGGVRAAPFVGRRLWWLLMGSALLTGDEPRDRTKETLGRGVLSLFGVDLSGRVGPGEFLPRETKDLLGPLAGDIRNFARYVDGDMDWNQLVKSAPALRDLVNALRDTEGIVDTNKRGRLIAKRTGWDRILQGVGIPLEKVTVTRDAEIMFGKHDRKLAKQRAQIVDRIIAILSDEGVATEAQFKKAMAPVLEKMESENIRVTTDQVLTELSTKSQPALLRRFKDTPLENKPDTLDMIFKIDKAHGNIIRSD
ncbi:MAG: hypothetical protein ACYS30_20640 [Planctomycetota bacterium]